MNILNQTINSRLVHLADYAEHWKTVGGHSEQAQEAIITMNNNNYILPDHMASGGYQYYDHQ